MQGGQTIAHAYFSLQVSAARKLNMKTFNKVPNPLITQANGQKHYVWESFQVPPGDDGSNTPGWYDTYANVEISEYNTWAEVINWALKVNPVATSLSSELAQRVAKLKADAGKDKEKYFREAVKIVQDEVRYMGIEIGEYSHRANHPENVFNQRYGDCKDKALLLASMLRANGIEAQMVLVNTSLGDKIDRLLPTTTAFNHAVVVATLNGKQVWVDATTSYQRGKGSEIYFPNYGKGLQLKMGNNALVDIPLSPTGKMTTREKYTVTGVKKKVRLDVTTTYTLNQADDVRSRLASSGIYTAEKNYLKYYAKIYPKIETKDSLIVKDDEEKNELITIESYLIPDFFTPDSTNKGTYQAGFYANCIDEQLPTITNQTKNPVSLNYPFDVDYTIEVTLPLGWDITERNYAIKREAYTFVSNYRASGNSLLLHYQFSFLKGFIPLNQLEEARKDISLLKDKKLSYSFTYTPGDAIPAGATPQANVWMIILAAVTLLSCVGLAIWIYHKETPRVVFAPGASFVPIGGWLILIVIGLFVTPLNVARIFFDADYFSMPAWNVYAHHSGNFIFRALLIWETVGNIIVFCLAVFCLVLLLNKRDILPNAIIVYFGFCVVLTLVDYCLAVNLNKGSTSSISSLMRSIVIAAIWIPYFKRSTRVKETFIVPHPPYNFSYEKPEFAEQ
jgi:transglutaminase-like putative cysteine protease